MPRKIEVKLHDGTTLFASVRGEGPAVLLPVRTEPHDDVTAESMRLWGADADLGSNLVNGLADAYKVVAADYEGHRMKHPATETLTLDNLVADLLAIADAAGVEKFAYYGYSWLALSGLQLAVRTHRLSALAMGGFPPVDGPYAEMLAVTRAAHAKAMEPQPPKSDAPVEPGDWEAAGISVESGVVKQFVTMYEALQDFDDLTTARTLTLPRLVFAGSEDNITYGAGWGDTTVRIAEPLIRERTRLQAEGWSVELLPGLDHMSAMHSKHALPVLRAWLDAQNLKA